MENLWMIFRIIVGVYIGLGLLLFVFQSRLIYYPNIPSREVVLTPADISLDYEPVTLVTEDKLNLDGWFVPAEAARGVILFFHGNAGNISHRLDSLKIFHALGYSTFIFDYRGYGRSEGRTSEQGTYLDAKAAWRYLTEQRQIAEGEIIYFGRSLGASIAAYLATLHPPKGLIIESAFLSVAEFAADLYPIYPARLLTRLQYDTRKYLEMVDCPVLVVHSRDDEIIPYKHGQRLFDSANEPKQLLTIRGGHNEGFLISGRSYQTGLAEFLEILE